MTSPRVLLTALGLVLGLAGVGLSLLSSPPTPPPPPQSAVESRVPRSEFLVAATNLKPGSFLKSGDVVWKEAEPGSFLAGTIARRPESEREYSGAMARRGFAEGEALTDDGLVKVSDRRFLSALLKPDHRAVSFAVDAPQTASGLILPGDRVDVILVQNLVANGDIDPTRKSVGETILRDVRVIALDRTLNLANDKGTPAQEAAPASLEPRVPRTVTIEVDEKQAETVFVAASLGKLQLSIRPLIATSTVPDV